MSVYTIPVWTANFSGNWSKTNCPVWLREFVGNIESDTLHVSFSPRPDQADTMLKFETFDGEEYHPFAIVIARTGVLISANDTGYKAIHAVVMAYTLKATEGFKFWLVS